MSDSDRIRPVPFQVVSVSVFSYSKIYLLRTGCLSPLRLLRPVVFPRLRGRVTAVGACVFLDV